MCSLCPHSCLSGLMRLSCTLSHHRLETVTHLFLWLCTEVISSSLNLADCSLEMLSFESSVCFFLFFFFYANQHIGASPILTWPSCRCLLQVCCHRLRLCQLSQAGVPQGRLRRRVLLPLQTGLASEPDVWLGSPAEGAIPPHPQQPFTQLHTRAGPKWVFGRRAQHLHSDPVKSSQPNIYRFGWHYPV